MAPSDPLHKTRHSRAGQVWMLLVPTIVFLILLIVFIAENGQKVEVEFFGASGHIALAVALLAAAVAGAVLVLMIGSVRIIQLRLAARRHLRRGSGSVASAQTPAGEPQAVETQRDSDPAGP